MYSNAHKSQWKEKSLQIANEIFRNMDKLIEGNNTLRRIHTTLEEHGGIENLINTHQNHPLRKIAFTNNFFNKVIKPLAYASYSYHKQSLENGDYNIFKFKEFIIKSKKFYGAFRSLNSQGKATPYGQSKSYSGEEGFNDLFLEFIDFVVNNKKFFHSQDLDKYLNIYNNQNPTQKIKYNILNNDTNNENVDGIVTTNSVEKKRNKIANHVKNVQNYPNLAAAFLKHVNEPNNECDSDAAIEYISGDLDEDHVTYNIHDEGELANDEQEEAATQQVLQNAVSSLTL